MKTKEGVEKILHVILILDVQGRTIAVADAKALANLVKASDEPLEVLEGAGLNDDGRWGLRFCKISVELIDKLTDESSDLLQTIGTIPRTRCLRLANVDDSVVASISDSIDIFMVFAEGVTQRAFKCKIQGVGFFGSDGSLGRHLFESSLDIAQPNDCDLRR